MKEHPILFSAPMVVALMEGRKKVTRRLNKSWLKVKAGDRLWVRETWAVGACADGCKPRELAPRVWNVENGGLWFPADNTEPEHPISPRGKTRPGIFLPRWASRILLECQEDARIERLQAITEDEAILEGLAPWEFDPMQTMTTGEFGIAHPHRRGFAVLWDELHDDVTWKSNPKVVRIGRFEVVQNAR